MLGDNIKKIRLEKGKILKEIAERANITIGLLSQIENNKTNPSINSLMAIAEALNVPIGTFFDNEEPVTSPVVKAYERKSIPTQSNVTFYLLTPKRKDLLAEFKYIVYEKEGTSGHFHTHEGEEYGIVLEGRLEVIYGDEAVYTLEPGDSIVLDSTIPHKMINMYNGRTITIWVDCPPTW